MTRTFACQADAYAGRDTCPTSACIVSHCRFGDARCRAALPCRAVVDLLQSCKELEAVPERVATKLADCDASAL